MHEIPDTAAPREVAGALYTTEAGLAQMRYRGTGPRFVKVGHRVLYRWSDVYDYLEKNRCSAPTTRGESVSHEPPVQGRAAPAATPRRLPGPRQGLTPMLSDADAVGALSTRSLACRAARDLCVGAASDRAWRHDGRAGLRRRVTPSPRSVAARVPHSTADAADPWPCRMH